jgi:murein hydrolase activator
MKGLTKLLAIFIALSLGTNLAAQSKEQLEKKRKRLENDIAFARNVLKKTDKQKRAELHELSAMNRVITQSQVLISHLKTEVSFTDSQLGIQQKNLQILKSERDQEQARLKNLVVKSYKSRKSTSVLLFVLSSGSFRQAMKRVKYLRRISQYKNLVVNQLQQRSADVEYGIAKLNGTKIHKSKLLTEKETESSKIIKDKVSKDVLVKKLSEKESELKSQIRRNEIAVSKLNSSISRLIAAEMAAARKREQAEKEREAKRQAEIARQERNKSPKEDKTEKTEVKKDESKMAAAPETKILGSNFGNNKGRLSWPVGKGYISQSFGVHPHPDLSGITLVNNGIDITTSPGSDVKVIFEGVVSAVLNIPGQQKAILVNHGDYFTVYSRLEDVVVSKGDKLKPNQKLGTVWTDGSGKTVLQFQIWKGQAKQNPASWIAN